MSYVTSHIYGCEWNPSETRSLAEVTLRSLCQQRDSVKCQGVQILSFKILLEEKLSRWSLDLIFTRILGGEGGIRNQPEVEITWFSWRVRRKVEVMLTLISVDVFAVSPIAICHLSLPVGGMIPFLPVFQNTFKRVPSTLCSRSWETFP